jgi:hypothetical protein
MKIFWKDNALNLMPETEEDGQVTSAILFAYGGSRPTLNLADVVFKVDANCIGNGANEQAIVGIDVPLDGFVESVTKTTASNEPL